MGQLESVLPVKRQKQNVKPFCTNSRIDPMMNSNLFVYPNVGMKSIGNETNPYEISLYVFVFLTDRNLNQFTNTYTL